MNMKMLLATAALVCAVPALASAQEVTATSNSSSGSVSGSVAGADANNAGNQQNLSLNSTTNVRSRDNTPDATIVVAPPTSPCSMTGGIGGSAPGFSVSVGGTRTNQQCMLYERARVIRQAFGDDAWARELIIGGDPEAAAAYRRAHQADGQSIPPLQRPASDEPDEQDDDLRGRNTIVATTTGAPQGPTQ